jgi:hypothetical protein
MMRISPPALGIGLLSLAVAAAAYGQDDDAAFDRTPQDCVVVANIENTDAIDDQNIIFHMRGNRVYRNHLPRRCPGLERENRITYQVNTSRLCSIDTITVLEDFGVGLRPGFTCRLGEFVPLSPAEVEDIDLREEGQAGQSAIETTEVEVDDEDGDDGEDESSAEAGDAAAAEPEDER